MAFSLVRKAHLQIEYMFSGKQKRIWWWQEWIYLSMFDIFGNITFMKTDYKQKLVEKRQNDYYLNNEQAWSASYTY